MVTMPNYNDNAIIMSETEYLLFEATADTKHEYSNGRVVAMTGASYRHNKIVSNLGRSLGNQLIDKNCDVLLSDLHVKVESKSVSYPYPDLVIVCGDPHFIGDRKDTITNPILLIEVLLPSTQINDRNEKLEEYLKIETLKEFILVSQDQAKVEQYYRTDDGQWAFRHITGLD